MNSILKSAGFLCAAAVFAVFVYGVTVISRGPATLISEREAVAMARTLVGEQKVFRKISLDCYTVRAGQDPDSKENWLVKFSPKAECPKAQAFALYVAKNEMSVLYDPAEVSGR